MILSLQYCKITRQQNTNAEKWMGHLRIKANACKYKKKRLEQQVINCINNDNIMIKIIRALAAIKMPDEITSQQVLCWARRVEAQRAHKAILDVTKETKEFDTVNNHKQNNVINSINMTQSNCRYCSNSLEPCTCPAYGKSCARCGTAIPFEQVCTSQSRKVSIDSNREKHPAVLDMYQDTQKTEMATQEFDVVLKFFSFHSVRPIIITKLKRKSNQRTETCENNIDTSSYCNLMPFRMYIMLFLHTNITQLTKSMDKKFIYCMHMRHSGGSHHCPRYTGELPAT